MSVDLVHIRQIMAESDCLYTEAEVEAAIAKVGEQICKDLHDKNPVVFCVMNGGLIFAGLLKVPVPEECEALSAWYAMMQERPSVENRITMSEPDMASG